MRAAWTASLGVIATVGVLLGATGVGVAHGPPGTIEPSHKLPDPGGSPNALVPIPAPGKHFGFNDQSFLNQRRLVAPEQVAGLAWPAGANVIRFEIAWEEVEPVRDRWDEEEWERYQAIDRALIRSGMRPLIVLGRTPVWARDAGAPSVCTTETGCEYPPAPDELDHWREFAAEVARRFRDPIIETWNEPNLALFFKPEPSPVRYARMHAAAFRAIKYARPRVPVLLGGSANVQSTEYAGEQVVAMSQRQFLSRIYPGVKGTFDGIGTHPYTPAPSLLGRNSLISHALHDIRAVQAQFKDRGNDIWVTETGFSTSGPSAVREIGQARGLLGVYRMLMTMADVKGVVVHTLFDQTDTPPESRAYGFGVIAEDDPLDVKAAYCDLNGRARRPLVHGCTRKRDGRAPGAAKAKRLRRVCLQWLTPPARFREANTETRIRLTDTCLVDLLTIDASDGKRVKRIQGRAASRARKRGGPFKAGRGRYGISLARRAVAQLARSGYS